MTSASRTWIITSREIRDRKRKEKKTKKKIWEKRRTGVTGRTNTRSPVNQAEAIGGEMANRFVVEFT